MIYTDSGAFAIGALITDDSGTGVTTTTTGLTSSTVSLTAPTGLSINSSLSASGTITVGTGAAGLINNGTINPGGAVAAGTLSITGDLQLGSTSVLNMEFGGTTAGLSDMLAVTGNITRSGTLNASLLTGYTPVVADFIPFMTKGGTASGTFTTTVLPAGFNVGYGLATGEAARLIYAGVSITDTFTGGTSLDWAIPANWSTGALPGISDTALISSGLAITHTVGVDSIAALTINPTNSLNISGGSLTVSGTTTLGGALTVSGTGSAALNGVLNGGTSGVLNVSAGSLSIGGPASLNTLNLTGGLLNGTGSLAVTNSYVQTTGVLGNSFASIDITQATGGLTVGSMGATGVVNLTAAGNISLIGAVGAGSVNLTATGTNSAISESAGGSIATAGLLATSATGGTTLNSAYNAVGSFSATDSGAVSLTNTAALSLNAITANGLTVSNSNNVAINGVVNAGTGTISVLSTGNLTLANTVSTTNATSSAVILNAGSATAAGISTGGDIIISGGGISTGSGGTALLYTGSVAGSTGLSTVGLTSGSGFFRYDSNATTANYNTTTAPLGAGIYAIYREQPSLTITANSPTAITYGAAAPAYSATVSGQVNGDTAVLSTQAGVVDDGSVSTSGHLTATTHTLTPSGAVDQLGYALNYATGTLTVYKLALTGTIATGVSTYGGALQSNQVVTPAGVLTNDVMGTYTVAVNTTGLTSSSAHLIAGTHTGIETVTGASGTDAGNYTYTGITAGNYTVNPLALTGSIAAGVSTYGAALQTNQVATPAGVLTNDVMGTYTVAVNTSGLTSTSGHLIAGTHTGIETVTGASGADAGNYTYTGIAAGNYTVNPATISSVTGITANNKSYDGTTAATLNTSTPVFSGQIGTDSLNVGTPYGAFSDRNVANGKTVTISGITLGGADAGNYILASSNATTTANITQLGSVAWVGGTAGNWSSAANWAGGAIPDGSNVAAVIIPSGVTVTYDSGVAGSTTLNSLSSSGTLSITAGTLNMVTGGSGLNTVGYAQTGGILGGSGNFTVTNNFTQSGGTITLTGSAIAKITQTGSLNIFSLSAPTVNLTASGVIAGQLVVTSNLNATTTSGGIDITNNPTAAVTLNNLTTGDSSPVTYRQNGQDLTIVGSVSSNLGSVWIDPPANLYMSGTTSGSTFIPASISSGGGAITVQSSGNIVLAAINAGSNGAINLSAGGSVTAVTLPNGVANLIGGTATLAAGGNVDFSAQVQTLIATGVLGSYTITSPTGAVLFSGSGTPSGVVQQLVTTVLPPPTTNNTSGTASDTSIIALITNNVLVSGTTDAGLLNLLYASSPTIGGIIGTFGGSDLSTLGTSENGQTLGSEIQSTGTSGSGTSGSGSSGSGGSVDNSKGKQNAKPNKC